MQNYSSKLKKSLIDLKFENSYLSNLFVIEVNDPKTSQTTRKCNYTKVLPTPVVNPRLIHLSKDCCEFLGLDYDSLIKNSQETSDILSGNKLICNSIPVAHCYVGHQFGLLAGQLGDGRAITIGDILDSENESLWELQLKGSGLTPYSRFADGRAVLRSSIREYLCSEHLWALGIPTTRALSLINSDSLAKRDPLYSGNVINENCAIVCRVAPSFFRFGSFEIFKGMDPLTGSSGPSNGLEKEMLPTMLDYLGKFHFRKLYEEYGNKEKNVDFYKKLYELICSRTAILSAYWQCYGFCHGVLNTDNMSILGLTIDFGPFGFLEFFDKYFICNHSDKHGRYAYQNQPNICKWNLKKLADVLVTFLPLEDSKQILNDTYDKTYNNYYYLLNTQKLGLFLTHNPNSTDRTLIDELYTILEEFGFDLTLFFRYLSEIDPSSEDTESNINQFIQKFAKYSMPYFLKEEKIKPKLNAQMLENLKSILESNPLILYSYGLDPDFIKNQILKSQEHSEFKKLYTNSTQFELEKEKKLTSWLNNYTQRLKEEFTKLKSTELKFDLTLMTNYPNSHHSHQNLLYQNCKNVVEEIDSLKSALKEFEDFNNYKKDYMNSLNPKFILRNHIAQRAIEEAEKGNYEELNLVFKVMTNPFEEHEDVDFSKFDTSIELAYNICVSCSS